jgi:hypothetical protein
VVPCSRRAKRKKSPRQGARCCRGLQTERNNRSCPWVGGGSSTDDTNGTARIGPRLVSPSIHLADSAQYRSTSGTTKFGVFHQCARRRCKTAWPIKEASGDAGQESRCSGSARMGQVRSTSMRIGLATEAEAPIVTRYVANVFRVDPMLFSRLGRMSSTTMSILALAVTTMGPMTSAAQGIGLSLVREQLFLGNHRMPPRS